MSLQTALLAALVVLYGAAQYALTVQALRDLARRPRVRGDNKVVWGIVILTVPIAGALLYGWMGPTSLVRRGAAALRPTAPPTASATAPRGAKVTPIHAARQRRARREHADPAADATRLPAPSLAASRLRPAVGHDDAAGLDPARTRRTPRTG